MSQFKHRYTLPMSTEEKRWRDRAEFEKLVTEFMSTRKMQRAEFVALMKFVGVTDDDDDWLSDSEEEEEEEGEKT